MCGFYDGGFVILKLKPLGLISTFAPIGRLDLS
jgi:hypothetical protein